MAKKKKVGRPKVELTAGQIKEVEELASYLTINQIADYLGISEDTFHEIKKRDSRVFRAYKKGKAKGIRHVSGKLRELIDSGDSSATIFFMKTQGGWSAENSKKLKVKITDQSTPVDIINQVIVSICKEEISMSEIKQITALAQIKQQLLSSNPEQSQALPNLSEEFILENIDKFNEAMRHLKEHGEREEEAGE